jgi:hypothetical protein
MHTCMQMHTRADVAGEGAGAELAAQYRLVLLPKEQLLLLLPPLRCCLRRCRPRDGPLHS